MLHCKFRFLLIVMILAFSKYAQVLDVPLVMQQQNQWCWAASSASVLDYLGKGITQCEVAEYTRTVATWHDFGKDNCCNNPSGACNYWNYNWGQKGSIEDILLHWGVKSLSVGEWLELSDVKKELTAGRPFIIRWALTAGGGHFVVGHGVVDSTMYYMDPWYGEGYKITSYKNVFKNSSHTWTHTSLLNITAIPVSTLFQFQSHPTAVMSNNSVFTWDNNTDMIYYQLGNSSFVSIKLYDLYGRVLKTIVNQFQGAGLHSLFSDMSGFPKGYYFFRFESDDVSISKRVLCFAR